MLQQEAQGELHFGSLGHEHFGSLGHEHLHLVGKQQHEKKEEHLQQQLKSGQDGWSFGQQVESHFGQQQKHDFKHGGKQEHGLQEQLHFGNEQEQQSGKEHEQQQRGIWREQSLQQQQQHSHDMLKQELPLQATQIYKFIVSKLK